MGFLLKSTISRKALNKTLEYQKRVTIISSILGLCFSSGVLLATTLIHILSDIQDGLEIVQQSLDIKWLVGVLLISGLLLGLFMEEIIQISKFKRVIDDNNGDANANKNLQSDMEMSETDHGNPKYNPKYEVRLSMSTNDMFPTYHTPEAVDTTREVEEKKTPSLMDIKPSSAASTKEVKHLVKLPRALIKGDYQSFYTH